MQSKDVLKEAIKAFDGTVIVVSHDREFLDGLVDKVYEFGGGKVREYLGGIYDWIRSHEQSKAEISQPKAKEVEETPVQNEVPQSEEPSKDDMLSYAERKERNKKISKLEKSIKEVERKIETLEKRLKELDAVLCSPEGASDMAVVNEYTSTKQVIDTETSRWEQLCEELEELR